MDCPKIEFLNIPLFPQEINFRELAKSFSFPFQVIAENKGIWVTRSQDKISENYQTSKKLGIIFFYYSNKFKYIFVNEAKF